MKKKFIFIFLAILILILICIFVFYKIFIRYNVSDSNNKILIEKSYSNYAYKAVFNGEIIFSDGSIYTCSFAGSMNDSKNYNINSEEGLKEYIINYGVRKIKKVSSSDLKEIENCIVNLNDTISNNKFALNYIGADQGTSSISVWKDGKEIILKSSGDVVGENKTEYSQKLLSIIDKYI